MPINVGTGATYRLSVMFEGGAGKFPQAVALNQNGSALASSPFSLSASAGLVDTYIVDVTLASTDSKVNIETTLYDGAGFTTASTGYERVFDELSTGPYTASTYRLSCMFPGAGSAKFVRSLGMDQSGVTLSGSPFTLVHDSNSSDVYSANVTFATATTKGIFESTIYDDSGFTTATAIFDKCFDEIQIQAPGSVSSDPGITNVASGIGYTINDVSLTGLATCSYQSASIPSSQVNLNSIKAAIKVIMDANNTTTASTPLSNGMSRTVQKNLTLNLERIPIQPSFFPCTTVFMDTKNIQLETIAKNQVAAKRSCELTLNIAGVTWNSTVIDNTKDQSDDDVEQLMENVEEIMRANQLITGLVDWSFPNRIQYHDGGDEETHLRIGIMQLRCKVFY